jgi:hypothetical protein
MPKVVITAIEKVRYRETHEMSDAGFAKYIALCESGARDAEFTKEFEHFMRFDNPISDGVTDIEIDLEEGETLRVPLALQDRGSND